MCINVMQNMSKVVCYLCGMPLDHLVILCECHFAGDQVTISQWQLRKIHSLLKTEMPLKNSSELWIAEEFFNV